MRGSVYKIYPQWQDMQGLKEKNFSQEPTQKNKYPLADGSLLIFSWPQKTTEQPLHCVFQIERSLQNDFFFVDFCSNMEHKWIVSFYRKLRQNLAFLPKSFFEPESTRFFLQDRIIPFTLPSGFLAIALQEGRLYFVDTAGVIHGEAFEQPLLVLSPDNPQAAFAYQKKAAKDFKNNEQWKQEKQFNFPQENIYCSIFSHEIPLSQNAFADRKIFCFFYVKKNMGTKNQHKSFVADSEENQKKGFWLFWVFRYRQNHIHQKEFLEKIKQDFENMQQNFPSSAF